jgi:CRISPR/Cas system-associated exonuclease Cas4 (RecB family)
MIQSLSTVVDRVENDPGPEVTVRCRIQSDPMPGETAGDKTVYHIDDPYHDIEEEVALSFWMDEPENHDGLEQTASNVLSTLEIPSPAQLEQGDYSPDGTSLHRGEEILVRAVPNRSDKNGVFFLNVTTFVIRGPDQLISKSKLRTQERCPREYYLRYVKHVYPGDKFDTPPYQQSNRFRGDAIHKITENALETQFNRFQDSSWDPDSVKSFCEQQFSSEFGFRQALLVLSGAGLDAKDHVVEAVTRLFTDEEFLERVQTATEVETERFLSNEYGYAGRVDILLDGVPYDIKTTRNPDTGTVATHSHQIKLYQFALLLEQIEPGDSFVDAVESGRSGYLVYPNTEEEKVRFESVDLSMEDIKKFLHARNDVIETGNAFAPPSTYNRECDGCAFAVEEWVSGADDTLPPACTYHCQNERRWPCYESDGGKLTTDCSLFDSCDQRTQYRDPEVINHYESVRAAFQDEKDARATIRRVVNTFDDNLLVEAGYQIPELTCVGASAAGTVIRFTTQCPVVPAFEPGEVVELKRRDGGSTDRVVYYGETNGEFLFSPVDESLGVGDYLASDVDYDATYTFSVEAVEERYLPYLDFSQRRNNGQPFDVSSTASADTSVPDIVEPAEVTSFLDRERLFVDLPVSTIRNKTIATLVRSLVTAKYPDPSGEDTVPEDAQRALVLGTTPQLTEVAATAQPDGDHYRLDGTGGPKAIQNDDGYHDIQSRLLDAQSLVSTVQQATSTVGPGGLREFFHRLVEGQFGARDHSDNFFDLLVVLGSERLTEPEYHFLSDVADRVVAVGDTRRSGPRMLSTAAVESSLDVFFQQEFERYRSFPTEDTASLQVEGEASPALQTFYREGPWQSIDGDLKFLNIEGDEETAVETVELKSRVPATTGTGRRLVFDVTDTPVSPMEAHELFEDRIELDATVLREKAIAVIDEESLYLKSIEPLDGENPSHHEVVIQTISSELSQFSRALLSNRIAEQIVTTVVSNEDPDVVVTPFERHATRIKRRLNDTDIDVPVRRPEELDGEIYGHAVASLATSNSDGIVRPPLDEPDVLYPLLSSGQDLTLVGNRTTLESKDLFEQLIDAADEYAE